jgi:hypothetical protein
MRCEVILTRLRLSLVRLRIRNVNLRLTLRSATNKESIPREGLPYKVNPRLILRVMPEYLAPRDYIDEAV